MNVCFAVQEMNVTVTRYIVTSAAAIGEMSSWHIKSKLFYFSVLFLYAVITNGPRTGSEPSSLCSDKWFPFIANASSITQIHIRYIAICYKQMRGFPSYIHMNESTQWLLTEISNTFWQVRKWWLPGSERQSAYSTLTNWFHVRYEEKKFYICYVLYMVCIVFVKINQTMFYRKTFFCEDVWKDRRIPRKKKLDYI